MTEYEVVIIGAGPGGYVNAIRCAQLGLKTAIIEKQWLGGVCLNVGCIPSKALLKNADVAHTLRERGKEFGFSFDNLQLDFSAAVKRSRQTSSRLTRGVKFLMKKNNIDVYEGDAYISARDIVRVTAADGKVEEIKTKNIVVATGSHPIQIPGIEVDGTSVVTYVEAILQEKQPKSVVIIGAGAIGVEFATIWSSYGTEVTMVEMMPNIVPTEDDEVTAELTKSLKKNGVKILTNTKVLSAKATDNGVAVEVSNDEGNQTLEAEQALNAIGFRPNTSGIGLEEIGVNISQRGFVEIDDRMATNIDGVWAIGDITGKLLLAHVASAQGIICAENIAGVETITLDYRMMPRAVYSHPQVASFGLTEAQAQEEGYDVKVGRFNFQANGKALGLGDYAGFVKIVSEKKYGEILGAAMVGPDVSELLPELTLAHNMELTASDIARNVHAHPTLSEIIMEAAHDVEGHAIHS